MSLLSNIRAYLLADTAIAAAVVTRIRPRKLDQGETLPAIRISLAGGTVHAHLTGASGLRQTRVQIDCYASTSQAADALADLVLARLEPVRGVTLKTNGLYAQEIVCEGDLRHNEQPRGDGSSEFDHISSRDYLVSYEPQ